MKKEDLLALFADNQAPGSITPDRVRSVIDHLYKLSANAGGPILGYQPGRWFTDAPNGWGSGSISHALDFITWTPFFVADTAKFDALGFSVITSRADSFVDLAVYDSAADGGPGSLLVDAGATDVATAGWKTKLLAAPLVVTGPTFYWIGWKWRGPGGAPTVRAIPIERARVVQGAAFDDVEYTVLALTQGGAVWPNPAAPDGYIRTAIPMIALRAVA